MVYEPPEGLIRLIENKEKLVPTLRDYISLRKRLSEANEAREPNATTAQLAREMRTSLPDVRMGETASLSAEGVQQETPLAPSSPDAASSRELLLRIADLSDEMVRACNEKVNVARFAYDLVRRPWTFLFALLNYSTRRSGRQVHARS